MFYDPLSVSNEEENAQNILCINDHRQWASPMFSINVNQALNGYVTNPNPTPTLTPNRNPNSNPNQINEKSPKETTLEIDQIT